MEANGSPRQVTLYDTMSRSKRPLETIKPCEVSLYVCGVTVYDLTHIGHARTFIVFDVVKKALERLGYAVRFVRNHTDVDDKIIQRAAERGEEPLALAQRFIEELERDMGALGVAAADVEPKVSDHIAQIISMVETLVANGSAYTTEDGDVYFRVHSFSTYGKLSGRNLEDMEAGRSGRVDGEGSTKEHPFDFALWKGQKEEGELSWESPWGQGRPGWHIECSAMSMEHLGEQIDIHGGGQDLTFPHHENEIAQSEACSGHAPFARNWMHVAMVNVDGVKMSKSLHNFWTTRDVLEVYHPEPVRFFMLNTHYRNPINYSTETLNEATRRVTYLYDALDRIDATLSRAGTARGADAPTDEWFDKARGELIESFDERFDTALAADFNTPLAVTHLHELARTANELTQSKKKPKPPLVRTLLALGEKIVSAGETLGLLQIDPRAALTTLRDLDAARLGIDADVVAEKIAARDAARESKDWGAADAIRDELLAMKVEIMDSPDGTTWRIHLQEDVEEA